ncbi:MAG: glycosyl hydrolase [Terriglobia bacterium]
MRHHKNIIGDEGSTSGPGGQTEPMNHATGQPGEQCGLTRRSFLQSIAALGALASFSPLALSVGTFEENFVSPPNSARMWTWWFWLSDRVDTKSITADLEAMKEQGIGGATVYSLSGPGVDTRLRGPAYMSPAWCELFLHTVGEARRLGLGVKTMLCSGWNAGGPWITPDLACKQHTYSELSLTGPQHFKGDLPHPSSDSRFYRDIAVQAFRVSSHLPSSAPDPAQVKARDALVALKNGMDSLGQSGKVPIQEICAAPLHPLPPEPDGDVLDTVTCIDLSVNFDENGTLEWAVPEGKWVVHRLGCTLTGRKTSWSSPTGEGLEGDPLDPAAMESQFQHIAAVLLKDVGPAAGSIFQAVEIDSWEIRLPNWTMKFLEDFRHYRGYGARPYLPALAGRTVGSAEISDRFLYDFRKTLGDCVAENYYGRLTTLAEGAGIIQQSEAGGVCYPKVMSMDALKNLGRCAVPMGEFWQSPVWREKNDQNTNGKQTACAAHLYGTRIAAAEAFASFWHWVDSPATLKPTADRAFCEGFNQFVIYSTATHSGDGTPGTEFIAGTHFNRKVTWWSMARPFCDYIARCSHLLQQGLFAADVLFYNGDGCPNFVAPKHIDPAVGQGYDYDVCNTGILLARLSVRDGRIMLPDGMSYRLMVLPDRKAMPLEVVRKLKELVAAGMTLVGPKPGQTPGLANYPECDRQFKTEADDLWGDCDGSTVKEHLYGKGRVVWGITPREILTQARVVPDFEHDGDAETFIDWIHRTDASREIYFVVNRKDRKESRTCTFRVSGRQPKIFDPVTGTIRDAQAFSQSGGRTSLPLEFASFGSVFVIFDPKIPDTQNGAGRTNMEVLAPAATIAGPWNVRFDPKWGGPASVQFPELVDWTQRAEEGIKYYSGTATYSKTFRLKARKGKRVFLDLGDVKDIAEVRLNGKKIGIAWTRPYRVEITSAVHAGKNQLEIDVVNLWPNRMIGDGLLPPDKRFTETNIPIYYDRKKPQKLLPSGLLGPVTVLIGS